MFDEESLRGELRRVEAEQRDVCSAYADNMYPELRVLYEDRLSFLREVRKSILFELVRLRFGLLLPLPGWIPAPVF